MRLRTLLPAGLALLMPALAHGQAGALDPTFDTDGVVRTAIGAVAGASRVLVQPDDKIVVVGVTGTGASANLALARYLRTGVLDATFGTGGLATVNLNGGDFASAAALQADGKIVVAGYSDATGSPDFTIARFTATGTLDGTFGGGDGWLTTAFGTVQDEATDVLVLPTGQIVAAGFTVADAGFADANWAVARYLSDGTPDPAFDTDGKLTLSVGAQDFAYGLARQSDGKLVVAGSAATNAGASSPFAVARFTATGALDATFGTAGIALLDVAGGAYSFAYTFDVALKSTGQIVVAGAAWKASGDQDLAVAQFTSAGAADPAFGGGSGWAAYALDTRACPGTACEQANALAVQSDGRIVMAGFVAPTEATYQQVVARLNADGTLDTGFDTDGLYQRSAGGGVATDVVMQPDNKVLVAGSDTDGFSTFRLDSGLPLPVELATFTAVANGNQVHLAWATASETNNAGFGVEARAGEQGLWRALTFVAGGGTRTEQATYEYTVPELLPGRYYFRLRQLDLDGASTYSPVVEATIGGPVELRVVKAGALVRLWVPEEQTAEVFDATGRRLAAGLKTGDLDVQAYAPGIYFVRAGSKTVSFPVVR